MFILIINKYCDYMIFIHKFIKKHINPNSIEEYIIGLSRPDALEFIKDYKQSKIKLYPTRKERYLLYKQLKGKDSPVTVYSYGKEKHDTRKKFIIKKN